MLRCARRFCCRATTPAAATTATSTDALDSAYRRLQDVWNIKFDGGAAVTSTLSFNNVRKPAAPLFYLLNLDGSCAVASPTTQRQSSEDDVFQYHAGDETGAMTRATAQRIMTAMVTHNTMDKIFLEAQRQGRISFYMTMFGEEAAVIGAAAGLSDADELFTQYRESGMLTYRGYTIKQFIAQCMGNCECDMKGRQMPIHYGSVPLHTQAVSSPLATQIPHVAGAGYAFRLENEALRQSLPPGADLATHAGARIAATMFGEGAASEGDFHAGVNFAAAVGSHALFLVRNNGYAISTPTKNQYQGDGVLGQAIGYGIPAVRVDGQDVLAVYHTVRKARECILRENKPVVVEALTYRISHHSTSDDSTAYRSRDETAHVAEVFNAIGRFQQFMLDRGWWTAERTHELAQQVRQEVLRELRRQEKLPYWPIDVMCDDVYAELTPNLQRQKKELLEHYNAHKAQYDEERA